MWVAPSVISEHHHRSIYTHMEALASQSTTSSALKIAASSPKSTSFPARKTSRSWQRTGSIRIGARDLSAPRGVSRCRVLGPAEKLLEPHHAPAEDNHLLGDHGAVQTVGRRHPESVHQNAIRLRRESKSRGSGIGR